MKFEIAGILTISSIGIIVSRYFVDHTSLLREWRYGIQQININMVVKETNIISSRSCEKLNFFIKSKMEFCSSDLINGFTYF